MFPLLCWGCGSGDFLVKIQGHPQIHTDTIIFRHMDEVYELPTYGTVGKFVHFNGIHYEAELKDIKKFIKEQGNG